MESNTTKYNRYRLIYNAIPYPNMADNAASSPLSDLFLGLHTAWPGRSGNQSTNESTYGNYSRVSIPRSSSGFMVASDGAVTFATARSFPASSASGNNQYCPFFAIGTAASGTGEILAMGYIPKSGTTAMPCTVATTGNLVTAPAHGAVADDRVCFFRVGNSALPGGITEGNIYWVRSGYTADTLTISSTQGGSAIPISSAGVAILSVLDTSFQIGNNYTPTLKAETTILTD